MAGLIQKTFNQAVNRTAFSLALQSVRLPLRYVAFIVTGVMNV
jgi:hypothetical protein